MAATAYVHCCFTLLHRSQLDAGVNLFSLRPPKKISPRESLGSKFLGSENGGISFFDFIRRNLHPHTAL